MNLKLQVRTDTLLAHDAPQGVLEHQLWKGGTHSHSTSGPPEIPIAPPRGIAARVPNRAQGPFSGGFAPRPPFGRPSASKGPFGPMGDPLGPRGINSDHFGPSFWVPNPGPPDGPKYYFLTKTHLPKTGFSGFK